MINGPGAIALADAAVSDALRRIEVMGEVEVSGNALTAGGTVLNDATTLVDAIKAEHGFGCTIFQGNVRVATTAFAAGKNERALGTRANEKVTQQVYRLGQRFEGITRTIGKDWVIVYVPLRRHTGQVVGMLAAYRELEDFFGDLTLLDDTQEAVFLQTLDGRINDANRAACDMLRLSKNELVGRSMAEFNEGAAGRDLASMWPVLGDEPAESDYKWRAADDFEFVAKQYISRIEYAGGVQGLTIARDCTEEFVAREELRLLNNELTQLNDSLEEKVRERTRSLQEALDELQATNVELKNTFDELAVTRSELVHYEAKVVSRYAIDKLRDPATYRVAFTVGTFINLFGHFLVPFLRGREDLWANFVSELIEQPVLGACSIAIAFLFPIIVQTHSAVATRIKGRATELLAEFPNAKPDPVFRAAPDGRIIGAGSKTQSILQKHAFTKAQDLIGGVLWENILELQREGRQLPRETSVHVNPLHESFFVTHAPSAAGSVNIYLTAVNPRPN